ncbi:unnamed protein product [Owenia fusiformis]|uniref:Uncharacterized protein n=1 Tax=Owenia fusiformis TaxID=6347 RepID=A0A8J1XL49_OWEFU|nr:unnamed protein product [Owenia fusiformis]
MNTMMLVSLAVAMAIAVSANPSDRLAELEGLQLENEAVSGVEKRSVSLSQYRTNQLKAHNDKRAIHNAPPLVLDATLNNEAQAYAEYLLSNNKFIHCSDIRDQNIQGIGCDASTSEAGENLAKSGGQVDNYDATAPWYNEVNEYDFCDQGFSEQTGHFTQVVWKGTTKVGFGRAIGAGGTYVVARYLPGGNSGKYYLNVGDAPASLNRAACPPTAPPSTTRIAECQRLAGIFNMNLYYDENTDKPSAHDKPACSLVCDPGNIVFSFNQIEGQLDCEKRDGSTGMCVSNVCT